MVASVQSMGMAAGVNSSCYLTALQHACLCVCGGKGGGLKEVKNSQPTHPSGKGSTPNIHTWALPAHCAMEKLTLVAAAVPCLLLCVPTRGALCCSFIELLLRYLTVFFFFLEKVNFLLDGVWNTFSC